jgi:cytochrome c-type biogenesis protein CcmE
MKRFVFLAVFILALLLLLTFQATKSSANLVLIPSQLAADHKNIQRIRVGGKVADLPFSYETEGSFVLKFFLRDRDNPTSAAVPVVYQGLKPDMFAVDRDVIVDGDFKDGTLQATNLLTQCPSKYEPPQPKKE